MALSDIALSSRALIKLGAAPISSFNDGTAQSEIAGALFAPVRDTLLSSYNWSFATGQIELTQLSESPIADFNYSYALPNDFIKAISAGSNGKGRGTNYRIARGALHSNADNIMLTYIFRPAEEEFPAYFDSALISKLSAEFCIPITESTSRAEAFYRMAEQEFAKARQIDAQQDTPTGIEEFILTDIRL